MKRFNCGEDHWLRQDPDEYERIKKEDPKLFEEIITTLFIVPIAHNALICMNYNDNLSYVNDMIDEEGDKPKRFVYPLFVFDKDIPLDNYSFNPREDVDVAGMLVFPNMGDIFIVGTDRTTQSIFLHAALMTGNQDRSNKTIQKLLGCTGGGCDVEMFEHYAHPFGLREYEPNPEEYHWECTIIHYQGPYQEEIRKEVLEIGEEVAKLSEYSLLQLCSTLLPGRCRGWNDAHLKAVARHYIRLIEQKKPIDQICSTFVALTYLVAFVKVFERKGKPLNLEEYFPLDPMNCLTRNIIDLVKENPKYWNGARIPNWKRLEEISKRELEWIRGQDTPYIKRFSDPEPAPLDYR